jgi:hypothetical protein
MNIFWLFIQILDPMNSAWLVLQPIVDIVASILAYVAAHHWFILQPE